MVRHSILQKIGKAWLVMMLLLNMAPLAHADITFDCQGINDPKQTEGWIVTIVEEQFGTQNNSTADELQYLRCIRKTTCKQEPLPPKPGETQSQTENVCRSEYVNPGGCNPSGGDVCQTVDVFVATSGINLLFTYIGAIYRWAAGVIGIVSVFYLVYGGIKISTAGDNTAAIDEAKTKITQSIAGLILLFLSAVILYTINPNFFTF